MEKEKTDQHEEPKDKADPLKEALEYLDKASAKELRQIRKTVLEKTEPVVLMRNAKASVFTDMFSERSYQRDLYESLTGERRNESEFQTITLENYLVGEIHNDLGFLVGNEIVVLCEAQSTWNENIVYRILCYLVLGWRRLAYERGWDAFSTAALPLPEPKLYVIYTGEATVPPVLKLSDVYFGGRHVPIEVEVKCVRGHDGDILDQYVRFSRILDDTVRKYGRTREAAIQTIERCLEDGILVSYIGEKGNMEMIDMLASVFDEEEAQRIHLETLVREKTAELEKQLSDRDKQLSDWEKQLSDQKKQLSDQKKQLLEQKKELSDQAEAGRLEAIVRTSLALGADSATVVQQLVEQGGLDEPAAADYLDSLRRDGEPACH